MRKSIFVALVAMVAALVMGALPATAHDTTDTPSDYCNQDGAEAPGLLATGTQGESSVSVCVAGVGAVTAAQTGDTSGVVVVDGDNDNALTPISQCLDGHLAVEFSEGGPNIAADDGEYTEDHPGSDPPTTTVEDAPHDASYFEPPENPGEPAPPDPSVCIPS